MLRYLLFYWTKVTERHQACFLTSGPKIAADGASGTHTAVESRITSVCTGLEDTMIHCFYIIIYYVLRIGKLYLFCRFLEQLFLMCLQNINKNTLIIQMLYIILFEPIYIQMFKKTLDISTPLYNSIIYLRNSISCMIFQLVEQIHLSLYYECLRTIIEI